jgi:hypothetical protein
MENNEIYYIILRLSLLMLGLLFWFIRWVISRLQRHGERISKIEGTCQEREKTIYKKEDKKTEAGKDSGSTN